MAKCSSHVGVFTSCSRGGRGKPSTRLSAMSKQVWGINSFLPCKDAAPLGRFTRSTLAKRRERYLWFPLKEPTTIVIDHCVGCVSYPFLPCDFTSWGSQDEEVEVIGRRNQNSGLSAVKWSTSFDSLPIQSPKLITFRSSVALLQ
ncbi:hypothetical protein Cni_G10178 [Canna indica]|uniref:Uncharacterized protein n=1 Tax=Canna indica TaxID=4628 RepID=A0AAQ3K3W4_9LILI|nr:hypothetical protein Cni_G10178 [Canna indica]